MARSMEHWDSCVPARIRSALPPHRLSSQSWSSSSSPSPRGGFRRPSRSPRTATSVCHSPVDCYLDNFEMLSACVGGKAELCCHHPGRLLAARVPPDAVLDPAPRLYPTGESTTCPAASRSYPPPLQTAPSGSRAGRGHLDQPGLAFPGSSFVASVVKSNLLVQRDVGDISKGHLTVDRGPEVRSRGL